LHKFRFNREFRDELSEVDMPEVISLEEGRSAFGADSEAYNDARPDYPARIYEILRENEGIVLVSR
jgi:hypothetical protein